MVQVNTPYAATPMLTAFLRSRGVNAVQDDLSIRLALRIFSPAGLRAVAEELRRAFPRPSRAPDSVRCFLRREGRYVDTVAAVAAFLQGRDPALAPRIVGRTMLPEGPRFRFVKELGRALGGTAQRPIDPLTLAFGSEGVQDRAKYLASLYLDDLADVIRQGVDSRFEFARYAASLATAAPEFEPIENALHDRPTLIDRMLDQLTDAVIARHKPDLVAITVPFPGNVYGAFRVACRAKRCGGAIKTVLGGGYVNTELRNLSDPRVFRYFDYVILDDGEAPLLRLVSHLQGRSSARLVRTFRLQRGRVMPPSAATVRDVPHDRRPAPVHDGLPIDRYLSLRETVNPMHAMWSDGRWTKLMLAHGCYWRRCAFCDTSLDHIRRYDPASPETIVRWMDACAAETGQRRFHFVDESASPALLARLCELLVGNGRTYAWWVNVRFEPSFTSDLARLMARAGCLAVSGALETASPRTLALMNKGVTMEAAARAACALADAGILVHAYLMYGFPSQTEQEAVDALDSVRQLFAAGAIHSAYWHRFALTAHSPIAAHPRRFGIRLLPPLPGRFARNEIPYEEDVARDWVMIGAGLRKAAFNFMHGIGLQEDPRVWFDGPVPRSRLPRRLVNRILKPLRGTGHA
jgi:radical SAM superfamily enzyme YgiQ (UPF0313 family)